MKKRELQEFKKKSVTELEAELAKLDKEKLATQIKMVSGKEKNLKALKGIRRNIAQIMTIQGIIQGSAENSQKEEAK